ncbi:MAG TPA: vWA domain-containing protein [Haliangiales bacterium]|nr:vWA domain-containing protein [Haliangiales bacterium]
MTVMVAGACVVLGVLGIGGAFIGRMVVARNEAQNAADAATLAASLIIRDLGFPFDDAKRVKAEEVARQNSRLPLAFAWGVRESADHDRVSFDVLATIAMDAPRFLSPTGTKQVSAHAVGGLGQQRLTQANRKFPRFILVLDYSGSMAADLNGGNGHPNSIDILKSSVNGMLDLHAKIKYGLVIFSTNVMKTVPLDPGTSSGEPTPGYDEQIRQVVNSTQLGNMTSTWLALDRARAMHDAVPGNEARHVLLVSDGQPHVNGNVAAGIAKSQASAAALWADQTTIWTLQIQNLPSNQTAQIHQLEAFMRSISGPPDAHPDGTYYRQGHTGAELADQFKKIAALIACEMGPLEPAPPDPSDVHIFLSAGLGDEEVIDDARKQGATTVGNLSDPDLPYAKGRFFFYKAETGMLYVTESVCKDVIEGGRGVVIRFEPPRLYE